MSAFAAVSGSFVREHLRTRLTLALLVVIPIFFVLIFASVLGEFAMALGVTVSAVTYLTLWLRAGSSTHCTRRQRSSRSR